ncbi:hypothetical protein BJ165DRAFT_1410304 [Panaeolus papilionaceus]|nr:hypothetical protein BJ165DRAFT_1410304 [Panaeolus papilionaceus]
MSTQVLNGTLGAAFLGSLAAAVLYGVTSVQIFLYFQRPQEDGKRFRLLIFFLWILDTLHMALTAHGLYVYLITNFGNYDVLLSPTWAVLAQVYPTNISDIIVRSVFARRVSVLCGFKHRRLRIILPVIIVCLSVVVFVCGTGFASKAFVLGTFERINAISVMLYTSFAAAVAADCLIATSLCVLLYQSRTGIKRTDSLLNTMMLFTINTGLLTSVCAIACLVTYAIWPQRFIFMGLYFALSKLYVNSLLASLNTRQSFRAKTHKNDTSEEFTSASLAFPRVKPDHNQGEPKQDLEHSTQVQSRTSSESRNT